jgi:hypothetical protein
MPGLQIRLWYRQAARGERRTTAVVGVLTTCLVVASLVVSPGTQSNQAVGFASAPVVDADAATAPGRGDPSFGSGAAIAPGPLDFSSSPFELVPPSSQPFLASGGLPPASISTAPVVLSSSDRGISETQVTVGFLVANSAGLGGAGLDLGDRRDASAYAKALVGYLNARGGVLGREVVAAVRQTDPVNPSDQAAACAAMVSDQKVFGVVDAGAISDTRAMQCIATENQMPYIHNRIWGTEWLARSKGLELGYPAAIDRLSRTWVRDLKAMGWLPEGDAVGILADSCPATEPIVDHVLRPLVERTGVGKVVVAKHDCDSSSALTQPASFVSRFRAAGVTRILLAADPVGNAIFMNVAQLQGYHPTYAASDWFQVASDSSSANYPADQFDGAVAITSNRSILPESERELVPGWVRCNQVAVDAGLPPLQHTASDQELLGLCDNFFLMVDGLEAAGPNPTRWDWATAVQGLGEHPSVLFGPSRFEPGKVTGSDTVVTAVWARSCTCFEAVTTSRPAAG